MNRDLQQLERALGWFAKCQEANGYSCGCYSLDDDAALAALRRVAERIESGDVRVDADPLLIDSAEAVVGFVAAIEADVTRIMSGEMTPDEIKRALEIGPPDFLLDEAAPKPEWWIIASETHLDPGALAYWGPYDSAEEARTNPLYRDNDPAYATVSLRTADFRRSVPESATKPVTRGPVSGAGGNT